MLSHLSHGLRTPHFGGGGFNSHSGTRALRVCHLGKFYAPAAGGIETHLRTLALTQADLGGEIEVICVNHRDRRRRDITWKRLATTATVEEWDGPVRLIRVGRCASLARLDVCVELPRVLWGAQRRLPDLLHLHVPNPTMLLALAAFQTRTPLVVTYHSDAVRQKVLGRLLRPFEHMVFRRAAAILVSSPTYPDGSELLQSYAHKTHVVPFGINLEPYLSPNAEALAYAARLRKQHGQPLWLTVGRLVYYKGLRNAVRALALVPGVLLVVGEGPLKGELQRLACRCGVADRIVWCGRLKHSELIGAYHAATALWFPSNARSEAFGFVQVEAMACSSPVINTAIWASGVPWVSPHEVSGLTVAVDDPLALAEASRRLLSEPGLRERLGRQARKRACQEFADHLMARRTWDVYTGLLEDARAADADGDADPAVSSAVLPGFASPTWSSQSV